MDYFEIINLKQEPFSNSPDPDFFFQSRNHRRCLQEIELSLRLGRGLNIIVGDVGTGKTTVCRQLLCQMATDPNVETHLILDPGFDSSASFLETVAQMLALDQWKTGLNLSEVKESIKQALFQKGVEQKKTVVLVIDEAQKLSPACLEILREFLNYETNSQKLLQVVIFGQTELLQTLRGHENLSDRVSLFHRLGSLDFRDTSAMIRHRLAVAGGGSRSRLFTFPALWRLYRVSGGYPRKIIHLCHRSLLTMIVQNRNCVGWKTVRASARRMLFFRPFGWKRGTLGVLTAALASFVLIMGALSVPWKKASGTTKIENIQSPAYETVASLENGPDNIQPEGYSSPAQTFCPNLLGQLTLGPDDTLWHMIKKVYGEYNTGLFDAVMQANMHIKNPKRLRVGQKVIFPLIPIPVPADVREIFWIKTTEASDFSKAFNALNSFTQTSVPLRLIPIQTSEQGLRFVVGLKQSFTSARAAEFRLKDLSHELAAMSKVIATPVDNTDFFTPRFTDML